MDYTHEHGKVASHCPVLHVSDPVVPSVLRYRHSAMSRNPLKAFRGYGRACLRDPGDRGIGTMERITANR